MIIISRVHILFPFLAEDRRIGVCMDGFACENCGKLQFWYLDMCEKGYLWIGFLWVHYLLRERSYCLREVFLQ